MKECEHANCAVVVACTELSHFENAITFVRRTWKVKSVTVITKPAPEHIFAEAGNHETSDGVLARIDALFARQTGKFLAIVAHCGCTLHATSQEEKMAMLRRSVTYLRAKYTDTRVVGIWVDCSGAFEKVAC